MDWLLVWVVLTLGVIGLCVGLSLVARALRVYGYALARLLGL